MPNKRTLEIVGAIAIIIALGILLWWLFGRSNQPAKVVPTPTQDVVTEGTAGTPVVPARKPQVTAPTIARAFTERFASYSTESNYKNIEDVLTLSTASLRTKLDLLALEARKKTGEYYGVSTQVIGVNVVEQTDASAKIELLTRRTESINDPTSKVVREQTLALALVKSGDNWLVDDFTWKD